MNDHAWPPLDDVSPPRPASSPVRPASAPAMAAVRQGRGSRDEPPPTVSPEPSVHLAAGVWRRTFATLIDLVVPLTAWALGTWALIATDPEPLELPPWNLFDQIVDYLHDRPGRALLSLTLFLSLQLAWPFVFAGRTPGKRALDVALLGADGRRPSRARCLAWALWRIPSLGLAGLGAWWALLDPERRTLHDRLARVWLVRESGDEPQRPMPSQ